MFIAEPIKGVRKELSVAMSRAVLLFTVLLLFTLSPAMRRSPHPPDLKDDRIAGVGAGVGSHVLVLQPGELSAVAHSEDLGQKAVEGVQADLALHVCPSKTTSSPT